MRKARVFYEIIDPTGDLTLSGARYKARKVMRPKSRKAALAKS